MKKSYIIGTLAVLFLVAMAIPVRIVRADDESHSAGNLLLDAALGAGEGAIVGKASGGKAGKGALIGAGTGLAREAIVKPLLRGGMQGSGQGQASPGTVTRSRVVEEVPTDPYTQGYQEGFKEGYNQGYKAGLSASQR